MTQLNKRKPHTGRIPSGYFSDGRRGRNGWPSSFCQGEPESRRRIFIVPRAVADLKARRNTKGKTTQYPYFPVDKIATTFAGFENNFTLSTSGSLKAITASAS